MTFGVLPDGVPTPGNDPNVLAKDSSVVVWSTAVATLANLIKAFFPSTAQLDIAEFWYKPTPDAANVFIFAVPIGIAGTSGGSSVLAGEGVLTFRTAHTGGLKMYFLETADANDIRIPSPFTGAAQVIALANYLTSTSGWLVGRNNDYPLVGLNYTTKENDVLRDKYKLT
jgi:hypothetical protein